MAIGSWDEVKLSDAEGVKNFTENGKCSNCGECCSNYLPLAKHEIPIIKDYIEKHGIKEVVRVAPLVHAADIMCPFRSDVEKKCLIYPVRPNICRRFKCDVSMENWNRVKRKFYERYYMYSMRATFYGHDEGVRLIVEEMCNGKQE